MEIDVGYCFSGCYLLGDLQGDWWNVFWVFFPSTLPGTKELKLGWFGSSLFFFPSFLEEDGIRNYLSTQKYLLAAQRLSRQIPYITQDKFNQAQMILKILIFPSSLSKSFCILAFVVGFCMCVFVFRLCLEFLLSSCYC